MVRDLYIRISTLILHLVSLNNHSSNLMGMYRKEDQRDLLHHS